MIALAFSPSENRKARKPVKAKAAKKPREKKVVLQKAVKPHYKKVINPLVYN